MKHVETYEESIMKDALRVAMKYSHIRRMAELEPKLDLAFKLIEWENDRSYNKPRGALYENNTGKTPLPIPRGSGSH